jgi:Anti-sigma-K factor rskA, C-terminal/Putative zinc-finger
MDGHEDFRELCAISVSGELSPDEQARLAEHLRTCGSCEKTFHQYRATVLSIVPQLAAEGMPPEGAAASSWEVKAAETVLFERLKTQERDGLSLRPSRRESAVTGRPTGYVPPPARWKEFGMLYAAGILLFLALAVASYRLGIQRGARTAGEFPTNNNGTSWMLPDNDHDQLAAELAERDKAISGLKQQIVSKTSRVREARALPVAGGSPGKNETLSRNERSISPAARMAGVEKQLAESQRIRDDEVSRSALLEAKVSELAEQLRDRDQVLSRQRSSLAAADRLIQERDKTITDQQDLLAHDRDIRELMGSRNLYIAEVYDVAKTGQTNKPFGRVFYTKGKSLIFYAYDLDQQAAVKTASIFQVWGSEGANQGRAVSLGVFFEDSAANKRWVLKAENARSLEQIDAVFVTIEPKGGSQKPSGKPVLFASLKNSPNHP